MRGIGVSPMLQCRGIALWAMMQFAGRSTRSPERNGAIAGTATR